MKQCLNSKQAFEWIIGFFELNDVPYLICGGLAAIAYGSQRPLHDIDIYVPENNYKSVVEFGYEYITYGPDRLIDNHWDVDYVQFNYSGQKIEVGSSQGIKIFDALKSRWYKEQLDFEKYTQASVLGKRVRIMEKQALIDYKRKLNREVDQLDIEYIENS